MATRSVVQRKKSRAVQRLCTEAEKAMQRAEVAKEQMRLAKAELKKARKLSKQTKRAAKQARKRLAAAELAAVERARMAHELPEDME